MVKLACAALQLSNMWLICRLNLQQKTHFGNIVFSDNPGMMKRLS